MQIIPPLNTYGNPPNLIPLRVKSTILILIFIVLSFSLVGCVSFNDPEASQEFNSETVGKLNTQSIIGQSFISRRPNLDGITIWIKSSSTQEELPVNDGEHGINIKLYDSKNATLPVFASNIVVAATENTTPFAIQIPNQNNPANERYLLQLSTDSNTILIQGRNEDAYPHGQAFINEQPINADIAFRLSYDYNFPSLIQDIKRGISDIWLAVPLLIILLLPGWLLLDFSDLRRRFDFGDQVALSIGISLSLIPITMLWTTLVHFKWTRTFVIFIAGFLITLLILRVIYKYIKLHKSNHQKNNLSMVGRIKNLPGQLVRLFIPFSLILIFLITLSMRMIMVRDLATPAWVDSIHHALITRLILSTGSYPSSYAPYWDINPSAYHPGFHGITATLTWLSNLSIDQSLLVFGQVLNALAVFSVYLFTKTFTRSNLAGLFAAFITGFLTPMPAYYTSWGRYTELAGLIIFPAAFALILLLMNGQTKKQKYWIILLCVITISGLFMVHYRVTVFLAGLILSYFFIYILMNKSAPKTSTTKIIKLLFIVAFASIFLVFPWMFQLIENSVLPMISSIGIRPIPYFQDFSWAFLTSAYGKQTLVIAGLGLLWGLIERKRFAYMLTVWISLLFLIANFDALHIPGGGLITSASVEIMLFIPISMLGGYFIDLLIRYWKILFPQKVKILFMGTILIVTLMVAFLGAKQLINILNPITIISRNADIPAIEWVENNIPMNETIVINPFAWGYGLYAGSDGGFWISPLSGRSTLPPPVLYGLGPGSKKIKEQSKQIIDLSSNPDALWGFLKDNQIQYIYVGAKGGVLSPDKLSSSEHYSNIYHKDGVWIFRIKP
jgi:hypothetical protein